MTWFRVGGAGIPATLKNAMNAVFNKKFGTSGQNYPPKQWPDDVNLLGPLPIKNASGAIASFSDGADDVPISAGIFSIVPSGGDGTPSAPVAISGYTGMNVVNCPNLCDFSDYNVTANTNTTVSIGSVMTLKKGTYTLSYSISETVTATRNKPCYETGGTYTFADTDAKTQGRHSWTFTLSEDTTLTFYWWAHTVSDNITVSDFELNGGSVALPYSPYVTPETLAVSWQDEAGIVYGGNLNVTTGVLTVNYILLDLSSSSYWNMNNDTQFRLRWANYLSANGWAGSWSNIKSNVFQCVNPSMTFSNMPDYSFRNVSQNYYNFEVKVPTGLFANASAFMSWLANVDGNGTHAYICIERNPSDVQTYQLTEHELRTFYGANNFYCDTGDSLINYRADISLVLQALQGSRSLSASLMRSAGPEEVSEPEENIQNTEEEQEGDNDAR